MSTEVDREKI